jgi:branched-chain amino acid transport system substrate-binding protein
VQGPFVFQTERLALMKRLILLAFLLAFLGGCGSDGGFDTPVNPIAPFTPTVYRIGVIAPLNAGQTEFGLGIRNSAQLAVDQRNAENQPFGPFFKLVALDDSSTPSVGKAAAQQLAGDSTIIGVVGTYNSGVAAEAIPVLDAAGIAMISPGNTDPSLTQGPDLNNPVRPDGNYFRLVVPDSLQGPALANYAFNTLGLTQVAIVTESKAVSQGLANAFSARFIQLGGTVLITEVAPDGTNDYSAILANVVPTNPELLFYAGEVPNASIVRTQATQAGIVVPLMGGDGVKSQTYIDDAQVSTNGDVASSVGVPANLLPSAAPFLAAYQAAGFAEPASSFGPYAYDATNLLIEASLTTGGDRAGVISFLDTVDTQGATGRLAFDAFGDTLNRVLTVFEVVGNVFEPAEVIEI